MKHARRKAGFTADRMGRLFGVQGGTVRSWEGKRRWKAGEYTPTNDFRYAVLVRFAMFASSDIGVRYLERMEEAVLEAEPWYRPAVTLAWLFGRRPPMPDGSWERYWLRVERNRNEVDSYQSPKYEADWLEFRKFWADPAQIAANFGLKEAEDDGRSSARPAQDDE